MWDEPAGPSGVAGSIRPPAPAVLDVTDLHLAFGGVRSLDGASVRVEPAEIVGLIGPNGAGKTSLFNCVSRLYEPHRGSLRFGERDLRALRPDQVAGVGIARTFQNVALFPTQSVVDNILFGGYRRTGAGIGATILGLRRVRLEERAERERAEALLDALGLAASMRRPAAGMPFGALKRVELARALMADPSLLLLDEPANGLMLDEVHELVELIRGLHRDQSFSVLLVDHHMGLVMGLCDRVVVLHAGQDIASGTPAEIQANPRVAHVYLGEAS